jgi:hypothetical protein
MSAGDQSICLRDCEAHRKDLRADLVRLIAESEIRHQCDIEEIRGWIVRIEGKIDSNHKDLSRDVGNIKWYFLVIAIGILLSVLGLKQL